MSFHVLVVDPDIAWLSATEGLLADAGYRASSVAGFEEAKQWVEIDPPDVLITASHLGAYNGLHLALRSQSQRPAPSVVITSATDDQILSTEAGRYGARVLTKPIAPSALLDMMADLLDGFPPRDPTGTRRWSRKRVSMPVRIQNRPAQVLDLSHGGMRLQMSDPLNACGPGLDVEFSAFGFSIKTVPRWSRPIRALGCWWCGAEILAGENQDQEVWRCFVDSAN